MSINPDFTSHSLISKYEPSRRNLAKSDEFAVDLAKSDRLQELPTCQLQKTITNLQFK